MMRTKVLLADDHALVRAGIRLLIETQGDFEIVGETGSAGETIAAVETQRPSLLLFDLSMPGGDPSKTITHIRYQNPNVKLLVVTMHDDREVVRKMLASGAHGYIVKSVADVDLLNAMRSVMEGKLYINLGVPADLPVPHSSQVQAKDPLEDLSQREKEVLGLLLRGYTNQAIADQLGVGVKSIESYRARMMTKLNLTSKSDLMEFGIRNGLIY
ncbi:MAG: response regulator transcription factor [Pirellula sp.]|jgi:DNA-binding NarL/FixJ family response regulator|nr:response regulator transcription factor [Pirellula sp.]